MITSFITRFITRARAFIARYSNTKTAVAIGVIGVIGVFLLFALVKGALSGGAVEDETGTTRDVVLFPAGMAVGGDSVLELSGEVKSQTQGDLRTQSAGVITAVNARVGQYVGAGTIIASIENASQRASVAQAQAGVAQAQASLDKVQGGTREEQLAVLAANTASARQGVEEAQISARNTLLSAYATVDSAFVGGVDALFTDADGANPELRFSSTNSVQANAAEHGRFLLQGTIDRQDTQTNTVATLSGEALRAELVRVDEEFRSIKTVLDDLNTALDGAVVNANITAATIASYKTTASSARSSVLSSLSTLSTARSALNSAQTALTVAIENEEQGVTGAQQEDISLAQAQLDSARASLASAVAALEKTRVRAPVSGTITVLSVERGDFVSSFQDIGLVANEGALEVIAYAAPAVIDRISVGTQARIDGRFDGVVTSIAPGINPATRQIEVRIALVDTDAALTNGARVSVTFLAQRTETTAVPTDIRVPISALKLVGSSAFVFSVSAENTLVAHPVVLGEVVQSTVEIIDGIAVGDMIVADARGLNEGDSVTVVTQ